MKPLSSHETWLSRLRDHLREERYHPGNARQCIAVARNFLVFLEKRRTAIADAQPEIVERYLRTAQQKYRQRHGHLPDYEGWRCSHTNGIHMLLRIAHGQWPPMLAALTRVELYRRKQCEDFGTWLTEMRGLAAETVAERRDEARRFLGWLSENAIRTVAAIKVADVDAYMKQRAGPLRRASIKGVATRLRSFLRWLHATEQTARDLSVVVIAPCHLCSRKHPLSASIAGRDRDLVGHPSGPHGERTARLCHPDAPGKIRCASRRDYSTSTGGRRLAQGDHPGSAYQDRRDLLPAVAA